MKTIKLNLLTAGAFFAFFIGQSEARAEEPTTIYLMSPSDFAELNADLPASDDSAPTPTPKPEAPVKVAPPKPKSLDEVLEETKAAPLNERQKRVVAMIERDQRDFIVALNEFLKTPFNGEDDKALPEFTAIRDRLVELVMKAHSERVYYERLYLINSLWLDNQNEALRFASLDRQLRDTWTKQDERRRRLQSMIIAGSSVVGAGVGGFVTFKLLGGAFGVQATDGVLAKLAKWSGRVSFTIAGAYVGSLLGRYAGFLGSDYVFGQMRDYLDPVDGTEDLRDLLDEIDPLP